MSEFHYKPAKEPTFYYIGVSTGKSSINRVFPRWAEYLGIGGTLFVGIDCKIHDDPKIYREVVNFLKRDRFSLGALITSHKIDLFTAARDLFDKVDSYADLLGETSCISKRDQKLWAHAKDPITAGLSYESFIHTNHWENTGGEICILGAGGASLALSCYLMENLEKTNWPSKIHVTNRSKPRLEHMKKIHSFINPGIKITYNYCPTFQHNDRIVNNLKPHSLVINGTGLGKDYPGSPLTDSVDFPELGMVWDFNYRGDLYFLVQARKQKEEKNLHIEDGWIYFLHGWTRVIAEVFHIIIPTSGPKFDAISQIAAEVR
ncbi:MAG: shikimate dehydrogenase [Candidatus Lokiarchaeota archaeon]|nr:shikimate dehydrogenase [Candidatus Lokiarchaeota archaeon]